HLITQVYSTYLQRVAGPGDIQAWLGLLGQPSAGPGRPSPDEQFIADVIGSPEYFVTSGNTELAFATSLYTKVLGRQPDSGGLTNALGGLLDGFLPTRQTIASAFVTSTESETKVVAGLYQQLLLRSASAGELAPWVSFIASGGTREQV